MVAESYLAVKLLLHAITLYWNIFSAPNPCAMEMTAWALGTYWNSLALNMTKVTPEPTHTPDVPPISHICTAISVKSALWR